ncbi:hypothetical protein POJ06DRAFT_77837 [Lipomyces tetrasporus]|uniref:Subtelomeric hrmA-associated cluster protein AFUB-079030/YDR124W-like helical bundle domain-containing protein n=1 Tax=Lipomyces tetrasporus TaxID=54092 RepID=A0AAD7QVB5_9ASCO|nr:uncharacterized protein POJ06DRAFT_77837 [Lipomyces tetrasporus]KAJ8102139.1 hypothetical protein POJ06DRAFT_77837 [Lipomyces tetrasporus]
MMLELRSYSSGEAKSSGCSNCLLRCSTQSDSVTAFRNSNIKEIICDLRSLEESQSLQFMLVLVQSSASQRAEIFTSAALDGHASSILPTDRSDHLLKLVADHRSTSTRTRRSSTGMIDRTSPLPGSAMLDQDDCELCPLGHNVRGSDAIGVNASVGYELGHGDWNLLHGSDVDGDEVKPIIALPRKGAPERLNARSLGRFVYDSSRVLSSPTASGESSKGETTTKGEQLDQGLVSPKSTDSSWSSQQASLTSNSSSPIGHMPMEHARSASRSSQKDDLFLSLAQRARPPLLRVHAGEDLPSAQRTDDGHTEYHPLVVCDREAVTAFFEAKFRQLQQLACKVVAKAWIKVIEPKKQSNHPYNKGDEFKPDWWPSEARHKEPDHLMKPERLVLLISMLRCGRVELKQLRGATTECAISIPAEKMEVLEEIYYVAEMEERYGKSGTSSQAEQSDDEGRSGADGGKQFSHEEDDCAVVVWTIAQEKAPKTVQAAAAAAVQASSRSLTTLASRMPVKPSSPAKRSSTELESGSSDNRDIVESQRPAIRPCTHIKFEPLKLQNPAQQSSTDRNFHRVNDNHISRPQNQDTHAAHYLHFHGNPLTAESASAASLDIFTPRDARNVADESQFVYGHRLVPKICSVAPPPPPLLNHRRYTTGSLQDLISDAPADPSSSDSDATLYAFPQPRRHSQQVPIATQPGLFPGAGSTGTGIETSFDNGDNYAGFVQMLSEVVSSLQPPKAGQSAPSDARVTANGDIVGSDQVSFDNDLDNIAAYAAGYGGIPASMIGVSQLGGLV